jgi:hypothetical protein
MLVRIDVDTDATAWRIRVDAPDTPRWTPLNRSGARDGAGFPLPPVSESGAWAESCRALCGPGASAERTIVLERFKQEEPQAGDVDAFGGYLWAVLLGHDWAALKNAAPGEPLRLQLSLPSTAADPIWQELPWELMVSPEGPLVSTGKTVAVTRLLASPNVKPGPLSIDLPLRVLFVVGRQLDNQLRAGTEYLSLLRRLQCTLQAGQSAQGVALHTRLLMEASTEEVQAAVEEFKPAVVHIISHGQVSGDKSFIILTRYDGAGRSHAKPDPVSAQRLALLLHAADAGARPHAVVLNACDTQRLGDVQASFAGELVRLGIPFVVGMAGEVADAACRLFARQLYMALIEEQPVDVAAAQGRRAALLHFKNHASNFDWARAALCQAEGVEARFKRLPLQTALIKAAETLRPKRLREPFCGRLQWLLLFGDLLQGRIPNLAVQSEEEVGGEDDDERRQIGKSRLLEELAWQSVLEGWVPLKVKQRADRCSNLLHGAVSLFTLMETTRDDFGVVRANRSEIVWAASIAFGITYDATNANAFLAARDKVLSQLEPQQKIGISADTIRQLLRADLRQLRDDIQAAVGPRRGVMILWDQLDNEEALEEAFVELIGPHGLGTEDCPAPAVFTYVRRSTGGKKLLEAVKRNSDIEIRSLVPFDPADTALACRQFLSWKKFVPSRAKKEFFELAMQAFEEDVAGFPSQLFAFQGGLNVMVKQKVVEQFDDAEILRQYV